MTRLTRFALAILDALDGLCRRSRRPSAESKIRITVIGAEETAAALDALGALAASLPSDPEPETITELVAGTPAAPPPVAPSGNPRVLGYVLIAPRLGVLISVESHDGGSDEAPTASCVSSTWVRPARGSMPPDALTFRSEDDARRLMWGAPFAIPDETEVLPVIVAAGE